MNFFVISDIHGSETYLKQALKYYNKDNFDKILICGDILYHGARNPLPEGYNPKGVINILNSLKKELITVRGNCESEVDSMVLEFPISSDYSYAHLGLKDIFITHGHLDQFKDKSFLNQGSIFVSGHTHIPVIEEIDGIIMFNPGSISLPKGGFEPSYGIITTKIVEVRSIKDNKALLSYVL